MNEYSLSDIAAAADGASNNGGLGGDNWCIWMMFLFFFCFGNNGWGNNNGANGNTLYPWLNQAQMTSQGFADQNAVMALNGISGAVAQGFGDMSTQLCGGFAGVQQSMANGFAGVEAGANARQIATMQQGFAQQTAMQQGFNDLGMGVMQGFNGVQQGFNSIGTAMQQGFNGIGTSMMQGFNGVQQQAAQYAYDTGLGMAQQTATILAEHCSDRAALSDGIRDIIAANAAGTQRILDKMCEQELYAERRENENLRQQVNMLNLAASQQAQTAQILADNSAQTSALEQYLAPVPRPCYVVQNPNCCGGQYANCGYAA